MTFRCILRISLSSFQRFRLSAVPEGVIILSTLLLSKPTSEMTTEDNHKVALITGITGQDGSYLAEFLLAKGYYVSLSASDFVVDENCIVEAWTLLVLRVFLVPHNVSPFLRSMALSAVRLASTQVVSTISTETVTILA